MPHLFIFVDAHSTKACLADEGLELAVSVVDPVVFPGVERGLTRCAVRHLVAVGVNILPRGP